MKCDPDVHMPFSSEASWNAGMSFCLWRHWFPLQSHVLGSSWHLIHSNPLQNFYPLLIDYPDTNFFPARKLLRITLCETFTARFPREALLLGWVMCFQLFPESPKHYHVSLDYKLVFLWCTEQTFGLCGRRRGWDVSREQHRNMYII